ncbi:helix-turn-helix domain-containing protein [Mycobacteroides abscessus]|uniref:helix-turn-helix domain-containing protein n=1 Tax=Mycobacteroides abscessus TaxID=36809 RepID=UPI0012FFD40C|nr:helix-turn-helix transcriptional regulator [Mycobacteroides abscessus]
MTRDVRQKSGFDGSRLMAARKHLGLTRAELARRLNTGWDVVLQWETGQCQPRPRSVPEIAAAVGVAVVDLYRSPEGAETLAERRVVAGLNQADVAKALGVNRAAISQWERGSRPVPEKYRHAYHRLLGLVDGDDGSPRASTGEVSGSASSVVSAGRPASLIVGDPAAAEVGWGVARTSRGSAARVAHLIVLSELVFSGGEFVDPGKRPKNWRVYSPQGIAVNKTSADLERLMEEAAIRLARLGYRQLCIHSEQRVVIDDEPIRVVRVQTSPPSDARMHRSRVFLSHFTPDFYYEGVGEDREQKAEIRREFEQIFPESVTGETLFVVAEPTDSYGWLQDQTLPYIPYTIVCHLPDTNRPFFGAIHYDHASVNTNVGLVSLDALGITRSTTISEIAERLDRHFQK